MKNVTLSTRIYGLAAILLVLLALLSAVGYSSVRDLAKLSSDMDRFYRAVGQMFLADRDFTGFRLRSNAVFTYARTGDFERTEAQSRQIDEALTQTASLLAGRDEERLVAEIREGLTSYRQRARTLMQQRLEIAEAGATLSGQIKALRADPAASPELLRALDAVALAAGTLSAATQQAGSAALAAAPAASSPAERLARQAAVELEATQAAFVQAAGLSGSESVNTEERAILDKIAAFRQTMQGEITSLSTTVASRTAEVQQLLALLAGGGILAGLVIAVLIARSIIRPLTQMTHAMTRLSEGDGNVVIPGLGSTNEIGRMAGAVNVFKENADKIAAMLKAEETTREIGGVISRAAAGDLTVRVSMDGKAGFLRDIGEQVNRLLDVSHASFRDFGDKARSTALSVGEASMAVSQVADGARVQNASLSQVATAVKEAMLAIREVSDNTRLASEKADNATALVERGLASVEAMGALVDRIAQNSRKVNQITQVIAQIANRTHILSLNAAIEAARAGEHGKGFVVVAQEVGKLAESAGQNANQIAEIVEQASEDSLAGKQAADTVRAAIEGISGEARQTTQMIHASVAAIEQQRASITQIDGTVSDLKSIANSNSAAAEEITATMVQLARLADETRQRIDAFKMA
ncbi:HAMP domain-containing protein [Microvirga tunisiensis]|uniref:HAMP domain-containing protein n=2 Tax=Pannonibacter tanglangensis TaxID=2750084 RepID=A0ABW9ZJT3_9HYPH|nr:MULTISPECIES: methyl-accepting chemotaxis protein [unclassified Pannonibacter]NBN65081.1 HAMP domain-containing protein [Pannonibacter sp. XCT-34]NBN79944.1 HAMP domain-containing protein [Pannonibacter sp. XCT-53]